MSVNSASASFQSVSLPCELPLDATLQSRSLQPLGTLQYNTPYGDLGFDKARRTLSLPESADNDALKLTALAQLQESLSMPNKVALILDSGVFAELVLNASADNVAVRVAATQCLAHLAMSRAGRDFILRAEILGRLSRLISAEEPSAAVRLNVLRTLLSLVSNSQAGVSALHARGVLEQLVALVESETELACKGAGLSVLAVALREPKGLKACSEAGLIPTLARVLRTVLTARDTTDATARMAAAQGVVSTGDRALFAALTGLCAVTALVSTPALAQKDECVRQAIVPLLTSALQHPVESVRVQSSLALQNLTNCESGKKAAIEAQALPPLIQAATADTCDVVQAQALQSLANLAEHPVAKCDKRMMACVDTLRVLARDSTSGQVRNAAQLAIDQITWQP